MKHWCRWPVVGGWRVAYPVRSRQRTWGYGAHNSSLWNIPEPSRRRSRRPPGTSLAGTEGGHPCSCWVLWGWPTAASCSLVLMPPAAALASCRSRQTLTAASMDVRLVAITAAVCPAQLARRQVDQAAAQLEILDALLDVGPAPLLELQLRRILGQVGGDGRIGAGRTLTGPLAHRQVPGMSFTEVAPGRTTTSTAFQGGPTSKT